MSTDKNLNTELIEKLELLVLEDKVNIKTYAGMETKELDKAISGAIEVLAELPRDNYTMNELLRYAREELACYFRMYDLSTIEAFYPHYVNIESVKNRPDNMLNKNPENWVDRFNVAVAKMLSIYGVPMVLQDSQYGWAESTKKLPDPQTVVAVFDVTEDHWGTFEGTFADNSEQSGMSADVVYANGFSRRLRYEGSIMEIMQKLV